MIKPISSQSFTLFVFDFLYVTFAVRISFDVLFYHKKYRPDTE